MASTRASGILDIPDIPLLAIVSSLTAREVINFARSCKMLYEKLVVLLQAGKPDSLKATRYTTPNHLRKPLLTGFTKRTELIEAFNQTCRCLDLDLVRWMQEQYRDLKDSTICKEGINIASENSHLKVVKFLVRQVVMSKQEASHVFVIAMTNSRFTIAQWIADQCNLTRDDIEVGKNFSRANCLADTPLLQWYAAHFEMTRADLPTTSVKLFHQACSHGIARLKWLTERFNVPKRDLMHAMLFEIVARDGDIEVLKWLAEDNAISDKDMEYHVHHAFITASKNNKLETAKWLCEHYELTKSAQLTKEMGATISAACENCHIRVAQWLAETFGNPKATIKTHRHSAFVISARGGYVKEVAWMATYFDLKKEDVMEAFLQACKCSSQHVAQWLADRYNITKADATVAGNDAFTEICERGTLGAAIWFADKLNITREDVLENGCWCFSQACAYGRLEIVKWLASRYELTKEDVAYALSTDEDTTTAATNGHEYVVSWLKEKYG